MSEQLDQPALIDISNHTHRHIIIAAGTADAHRSRPTTFLLSD